MITALFDRSDYPCLKDYAYLNQASLGLIGQPAVQSMHDFLDDTARHGNLRMTDDDEAGFFEALRRRGARLLGCRGDELAIAASASELLGQLPILLRPGVGSSIVAVATDFPDPVLGFATRLRTTALSASSTTSQARTSRTESSTASTVVHLSSRSARSSSPPDPWLTSPGCRRRVHVKAHDWSSSPPRRQGSSR